MPKKKSNKFTGVFKIFFSSIRSYFLYLDQTSKALAFPIFGQIFSLALIFVLTYFFTINSGSFNSLGTMSVIYLISIAVLLLVFVKAFYDYIINFSALNILFYTHNNKKTVKKINFKENNAVIQRKLFKYIILMLIVTVLLLVPLLGIFLCLTFQIFAFESDLNPFQVVKRSFNLTKSYLLPTITLILLCFVVTYMFLPSLLIWAIEKSSFYSFLIVSCEKFFNLIPISDYVNNLNLDYSLKNYLIDNLSPLYISKMFVENIFSFIIIGFTLPFRCSCFTELYRLYDNEKIKEFSKNTDEIIKRAIG